MTKFYHNAKNFSINKWGDEMRKFDVIRAITDEKKFSELIFDLVSACKTSEELTKLLQEEMTEDAFRTVKELNDSEYPLQLDYLFATDESSE